MSQFTHLTAPASGEAITLNKDGSLTVPANPIIPFIEGDGIGADIWASSVRVIDAAVAKAYGGDRQIEWFEIFAGEKCFERFGKDMPEGTPTADRWLLKDSLTAVEKYLIGIKGPLTTPVGGGIRSLNVALRQKLDLYACVRPVRWFQGDPSPVKNPAAVDMVIFRENTEDIYAGIEWKAGTPEVKKVIAFLQDEMGVTKIRFPETSGIGVKPVSEEGTKRLVRAAMKFAIEQKRDSVTLVHKGNIMKFTEGSFKDWGYEVAREEFGGELIDGGPWTKVTTDDGHEITVKDVIADAMLQQILLRPAEYDVIATLNLNGDYISDALAAMVGGIGIAPGANINYETGQSIFEATHGTAPKYAGQDKVNPSSVLLSAVMMLDRLGWHEAGALIVRGIEGAIAKKTVTYDFHRLMDNATKLKCSEFGDAIIANMD